MKKKIMLRPALLAAAAFLICCGLSGCAQVKSLVRARFELDEEKEEEEPVLQPGEFMIYYSDRDSTSLIGRRYTPEAENFEGILQELIEQFQTPPDAEVISALPGSVSINGYTQGVDNLTIDFNAAYLGLGNVQEVLLRAGIVKTLVQLPGVLNVSVTVDTQPLKEPDGSVIGGMNAEMFIEPSGDEINSVHKVMMDLYFPSADGTGLIREERSSDFSTNLMLEKILIEQLIAGPDGEGLLPVCYPDVIINSVLVENDICTIDFNSRFNEADAGIADPELSLYAFVNTITDAPRLDGVVIRIDGSTDVRFRSQVSLDQVFKKNYAIVEESEDEDRDAAVDGQGEGGNAQAGDDAGEASNTDTRKADNDSNSTAASADALVGIVQGEQETE